MPPFVHRYSRAAFADNFLPVMPPQVHYGGICGYFSISNAAICTQQGGICGLFSTNNAATTTTGRHLRIIFY
jgi:hypothetical protein